jgi:hypothetical protein
MKKSFDKHSKLEDFLLGDLVLRYDTINENKGKNRKFYNMWMGPFRIGEHRKNNAYFMEELNGESIVWGPVNSRFPKHYLMK